MFESMQTFSACYFGVGGVVTIGVSDESIFGLVLFKLAQRFFVCAVMG